MGSELMAVDTFIKKNSFNLHEDEGQEFQQEENQTVRDSRRLALVSSESDNNMHRLALRFFEYCFGAYVEEAIFIPLLKFYETADYKNFVASKKLDSKQRREVAVHIIGLIKDHNEYCDRLDIEAELEEQTANSRYEKLAAEWQEASTGRATKYNDPDRVLKMTDVHEFITFDEWAKQRGLDEDDQAIIQSIIHRHVAGKTQAGGAVVVGKGEDCDVCTDEDDDAWKWSELPSVEDALRPLLKTAKDNPAGAILLFAHDYLGISIRELASLQLPTSKSAIAEKITKIKEKIKKK